MSPRARKNRRYVVIAITLAAALALCAELRASVAEVDGPEMEPSLRAGDVVWVNRFAYVLFAPARGDVVLLSFEGVRDVRYVRRIVGLPQERVDFVSGQLSVGGTPVSVSPLAGPGEFRERIGDVAYPVIHSEGPAPPPQEFTSFASDRDEFFVLADRRPGSADSRFWGPISRDQILGRVVAAYDRETGSLHFVDHE